MKPFPVLFTSAAAVLALLAESRFAGAQQYYWACTTGDSTCAKTDDTLANGTAIWGNATGSGSFGVFGTGQLEGVKGAVFGTQQNVIGVHGFVQGVGSIGVLGESGQSGLTGGTGVSAYVGATGGTGYAIYAVCDATASLCTGLYAAGGASGSAAAFGGSPQNGGRVQFDGDLYAKVDNLYNIGSASRRFSDIYLLNQPHTGSDARMKKDVVNLPYGLDDVLKLRAVTYRLKDGRNDDRQLGLIAQEVEKVVPDVVVHGDNPSDPLSLRYEALVPVLIKAIQEQETTIATLERQRTTQMSLFSNKTEGLTLALLPLGLVVALRRRIRLRRPWGVLGLSIAFGGTVLAVSEAARAQQYYWACTSGDSTCAKTDDTIANGTAIWGNATGADSYGVFGTGQYCGVKGAVYGNMANNVFGVHGYVRTQGSTAVLGEATNTSGIGVKGIAHGDFGTAVVGVCNSSGTSTCRGLYAAGGGGYYAAILDGRVEFQGDLLPDDNGHEIGSIHNRFANIYLIHQPHVGSDARLKTDIEDLSGTLSAVLKLRPVAFRWNEGRDDKRQLGLIAQEVDKVVPEVVVHGESENDPLSLRYSALLPMLVKAVQEQQARIATLEEERTPIMASLFSGGFWQGTALGLAGLFVAVAVRRRRARLARIVWASAASAVALLAVSGVADAQQYYWACTSGDPTCAKTDDTIASGTAIWGNATGVNSFGVFGTGQYVGVKGGVFGSSANALGVYGWTPNGIGVFAEAVSPSLYGVKGLAHGASGYGVYAVCDSTAGSCRGITARGGSGGLAAEFQGTVRFGGDFQVNSGLLLSIGDPLFRFSTIWLVNMPNVGSDASLKKDIENAPYGLDEVLKLRPVTYRWKDGRDKRRQPGLIAQEVEKVIPEIVSHGAKPADPLSVQYEALVPVLIKSIQEQRARIVTLQRGRGSLLTGGLGKGLLVGLIPLGLMAAFGRRKAPKPS